MTLLRIGPPDTGGGFIREHRRHFSNRPTWFSSNRCRNELLAIQTELHTRRVRVNRWLSTKDGEDQAQNDADQDAGDDRKIEREIALPVPNIARQTPQPRRSEAAPKKQADYGYDDADDQQNSPDVAHSVNLAGTRQL